MRGSGDAAFACAGDDSQINRVLAAIAKLSFTTRGLYGEGTQASGNFFQIPTRLRYATPKRRSSKISRLDPSIIEQEQQARDALLMRERPLLEDRINRSSGFCAARISLRARKPLSAFHVRLGVDLGMSSGDRTGARSTSCLS